MLAIHCFGHFWSKALVDWGTRGKGGAGRLRGYQLRDREPFVVDFKEQIAIYTLFSANREVVYVGQTGSGDQRLMLRLRQHSHENLRDRWTHFSWFGLRAVTLQNQLSDHQKPDSKCGGTNAQALDEIEAVLLQLFEPRLNKQGPKWGEDTEEFFQYVPWEFGEEQKPIDFESINSKIDELSERIDKLNGK
jgi:hypothetical protein